MSDENGICGASYVLEYWCGPTGCNQNISMCSHGMLDRYRFVTIHFSTAVVLLTMMGGGPGTPKITWGWCFFEGDEFSACSRLYLPKAHASALNFMVDNFVWKDT